MCNGKITELSKTRQEIITKGCFCRKGHEGRGCLYSDVEAAVLPDSSATGHCIAAYSFEKFKLLFDKLEIIVTVIVSFGAESIK